MGRLTKGWPTAPQAGGRSSLRPARWSFLLAFALRLSLCGIWSRAGTETPPQAANCCLSTRSGGPNKCRAFFFGTGWRVVGEEESGNVNVGGRSTGGCEGCGGPASSGMDPLLAQLEAWHWLVKLSGVRSGKARHAARPRQELSNSVRCSAPPATEEAIEPASQPWPTPAAAAAGVCQDLWA